MDPLEGGLRGVNGPRGGIEEGIAAQPGDSPPNCVRVDAGEG